MHEATGGQIRGAFLRPSEVREIEIDPATGALALRGCPERQSELFLTGTLPEATCPGGEGSSYAGDDAGGTRREFFEWLRRHL